MRLEKVDRVGRGRGEEQNYEVGLRRTQARQSRNAELGKRSS
ncbi:hypothetical protein D1AOALGA4SA_5124 [Olavius algarvensis Delta 1 endosymbiont]|nr:hypothetical protein D1AOALGA4SA_5124 [Olavius algarvensis Delta 1 endosymbiont]